MKSITASAASSSIPFQMAHFMIYDDSQALVADIYKINNIDPANKAIVLGCEGALRLAITRDLENTKWCDAVRILVDIAINKSLNNKNSNITKQTIDHLKSFPYHHLEIWNRGLAPNERGPVEAPKMPKTPGR